MFAEGAAGIREERLSAYRAKVIVERDGVINRNWLLRAKLGFAMSGVKGQGMAVMESTHLLERIGKENIYATTEEAVAQLVGKVHENTDLPVEGSDNYPLTRFIPN